MADTKAREAFYPTPTAAVDALKRSHPSKSVWEPCELARTTD